MKIQSVAAPTSGYTVRDVMQRGIITVPPDMGLKELAEFLTQRRITGAPVVDENGDVIGVVSVTDLVAWSARGAETITRSSPPSYYSNAWFDEEEISDGFYVENLEERMTVSEIMTPVVHIVRDTDAVSALVRLMMAARIHRVLVSDGNSIVGIVTTSDLISLIPGLIEQSEALNETGRPLP